MLRHQVRVTLNLSCGLARARTAEPVAAELLDALCVLAPWFKWQARQSGGSSRAALHLWLCSQGLICSSASLLMKV